MCTHLGPFDTGTLRCTLADHPEHPNAHRYEGTGGGVDAEPGAGDA